jgi:hypothetical protein
LVRYVGFYIALSVVRRDYRSAWAVLQGISAFLRSVVERRAGVRASPPERMGDGLKRVFADKDS